MIDFSISFEFKSQYKPMGKEEIPHVLVWIVPVLAAISQQLFQLIVHFGYLFGFMVEKGAEFPEGDERRRWKYRVVFQGNNVRDQDWKTALFTDMQSTPATLEASRVADINACFPGHKDLIEKWQVIKERLLQIT